MYILPINPFVTSANCTFISLHQLSNFLCYLICDILLLDKGKFSVQKFFYSNSTLSHTLYIRFVANRLRDSLKYVCHRHSRYIKLNLYIGVALAVIPVA